jgi:phage-related protein
MSADGSVEVQVSAEGADAAADDLAEASETGVSGGQGAGGLSSNLRGGIIGGALVSALGPLLDVLNPILDVLKAFLAPLAAVVLRLFAPVLRFLLSQVLPLWMEAMTFLLDNIGALRGILMFMAAAATILSLIASGIGFLLIPLAAIAAAIVFWEDIKRFVRDIAGDLRNVPGMIWSKFKSGWSWLSNGAWNIAKDVWSFVSRLPSQIGQEIAQRVPGIPSGEDVTDTTGDLIEGGNRFVEKETSVNIVGGLEAFIDRIERSSNIDLP